MAIRLKQAGRDDFVVLERGDEVGGTWQANTYPGCACDVPSHLYSFSFAPNPEWTQTYSPQPEIGAYLRRCADDFGVRPHIRLSTTVESADLGRRTRSAGSSRPTRATLRARVLVAGHGAARRAADPRHPRPRQFEGATFHSARWDHDYDLAGKRVASIGTGASAIQFVPAIQPRRRAAARLPAHPAVDLPRTPNRPITTVERRAVPALPGAAEARARRRLRAARGGGARLRQEPAADELVEKLARRHMRKQITRPGAAREGHARLHDRLQADPAVEPLVPGARASQRRARHRRHRARSRPHAIVTADGVEREVDTIIFGTGFHVTDMPAGQQRARPRAAARSTTSGRAARTRYLGHRDRRLPEPVPAARPEHRARPQLDGLHDRVADRLRARGAARRWTRRGAATIEVRARGAGRATTTTLDRRMLEGTVWNTGCASWYLDDTGRNATLWPDWTWRFRRRAARFDRDDYELDAAPVARARGGGGMSARVLITGAAAGSAPRPPRSCARSGAHGRRARPRRRRRRRHRAATCATRSRSTAPSPRRSSASAGSTC